MRILKLLVDASTAAAALLGATNAGGAPGASNDTLARLDTNTMMQDHIALANEERFNNANEWGEGRYGGSKQSTEINEEHKDSEVTEDEDEKLSSDTNVESNNDYNENGYKGSNKTEFDRKLWKEILDSVMIGSLSVTVPLALLTAESGSTSSQVVGPPDQKNVQPLLWSNPAMLSRETETYKLEEFENNIMIVFNHTYVLGFPEERLGTNEDVAAIKKTFVKYRFLVTVELNKTIKELFEILHKFAEKGDFSKTGCIAVVVLSHGGNNGNIFAEDNFYHESDLLKVFQESKNETLFGKPIIFIIQTHQTGEQTSFDQACRKDNLTTDNRNMGDYYIPIQADTLLLHSTYYREISVRNTENGSWFIQALCEAIQMYDSEDFLSIIVRVVRSIALYKEYLIKGHATKENIIFKQIPMYTSTLTRKIFLNRPRIDVMSNEPMADQENST